MSDHIISVENLRIAFQTHGGKVTALDDVSFELRQGEALGIVGESGSGKTVTCRSLLRLLPANARIETGTIRFGDADVLSLSRQNLARIRGREAGMIFQTPSTYLDPLMRVGEQVAEGLRFHLGVHSQTRHAQAIELLDRVHIAQAARRVRSYPHELSGGMRQRVMIAAALASRPRILVADEPTTALDVTIQASVLELLKELRAQQRLSLIFVSHDLGVVASLCDRVLVMKDGKVIEEGPTRQILLQPQASYTRQLIASHPAFERGVVDANRSPSAASDKTRQGKTIDVYEDKAILCTENLSVVFGSRGRPLAGVLSTRGDTSVRAVQDVSLSVGAGEALGIVGESGSGKSTIARAIVGLVQPTAGRILYKGRSVNDLRKQDVDTYRRSVQLVFQDPYGSLNPRFTVEQALAEPLRRHRLCDRSEVSQRVAELMRSVELSPGLRTRRPLQLSGGQCQRVAIARGLAMAPEILVADEITSALDVTVQAQVLDLLERLQRTFGLTIIYISHDLGLVQRLCQNVAVMRSGRRVEYGPTEQILRNPQTLYTKELISAVPRMPVATT